MSGSTLTDAERQVSQRLSQGFAWPTVLLLVALITIEVAVIAAWAAGAMPLLAGMFINSLAGYGLYTVVHAPLLSERGAVVAGPSSDPRVSVQLR